MDVLVWIESKFDQCPNKEVDLNSFVSILTECGQFKSKEDASHYFQILDEDKSGSIDFSEFLAPLMPELSTLDV